MYLPQRFEERDPARLFEVMDQFPLATVVTVKDGEPFINHLPLTVEKGADGTLKLYGHMSRHNDQWRHFAEGASVSIAFHGPQAYINSSWYVESDVPTWSYIVVHARGKAEVVSDSAGMIKILQRLNDQMNRSHSDQWEFYLPPDLRTKQQLESSIVGFVIEPVEIKGKYKLLKSRSQEDQSRVIEGLEARSDFRSHELARWMKKESR